MSSAGWERAYFSIIACLVALMIPFPSFAGMKDYCQIPPYVTAAKIRPNIFIVYEKSAEILKRAYPDSYNPDIHYYGFFDSNDKYIYNSTGGYFIKDNNCTGNNCFPGNLLNWALMSSLDLSRKALVGFGWVAPETGTGAGEAFVYSGNLFSEGEGDNAIVSGGGYTFCLTKATDGNPTQVTISLGRTSDCIAGMPVVGNGNVTMLFNDENRTGIIQEYADKDRNYEYDEDAPRFGVRRWNNGSDKQEDILRDSPPPTSSERKAYFKNILTAISKAPPDDPQTPYLSEMMKELIEYMRGASSSYNDNDSNSQTAYSWANDSAGACRKTFALFLTTGSHLGQDNSKILPLPAACNTLQYSDAFTANACYAYNTDLHAADGTPPRQKISTSVVHTTFYGNGVANEQSLNYTAGVSDGAYFRLEDPYKFPGVLEQALQDILKRSASGTAASVLASGEGAGASMIQAVFYPQTPKMPHGIFDRSISWAGKLQSLWYHIDPFFSKSSIREDTAGDRILNLLDDHIVQFYYDQSTETSKAGLYADLDGNGSADSSTPSRIKMLEEILNLWDAGIELWERDLTVSPRKIYVPASVTGATTASKLDSFSTANASSLKPYFDLPAIDHDRDGFKDGDINHDGIVDDSDAQILTRYIRGEDSASINPSYSWLRSRTVAIDLNSDGDTADAGEGPKVWKLGDILHSTPQVSSWMPLNMYHTVYNDATYGVPGRDITPGDPPDPDHYVTTSGYLSRGMVFTGANDGMLHAFKLGKLEFSGSWKDSDTKKARLANPDPSTPLGHEAWAFIPGNVLPYLKYLLEIGYCHIYTVDLSPFIFDASINGDPEDQKTAGSWRTVLIGGMRLGGACRDAAGACNAMTGNMPDCVRAPVNGNGLSSYFALDITNQNNPKLLWEFSDPRLGFTTTGPAIVRTGTDREKNGHWYVVFGSGPTGPIDAFDRQFLGRSDQNLRIFILNLKDGSLSGSVIDTGIQNAFAGSLFNSTHDTDLDYQDDVLYMPYVKKDSDGTWTDGGVLRVLTKDAEPSGWSVNKLIEFSGDNGGPVTTSIVRIQNQRKGTLWLYFGTGRYYFEHADDADDRNKQRRLFGIKDPCYSATGFASGCPAYLSGLGGLTDVSDTPDMSEEPDSGWYLNLDASGKYSYLEGIPPVSVSRNYAAERVITDPVSTGSGLVFFTTYKPYTDECALGGKSFIWAVKYNTGGCAGAFLKGKALLQVSTGSIEQRDLGTTFNHADSKGGRKSQAMEGAPPINQGLSVLTAPPPVKKVLHIWER